MKMMNEYQMKLEEGNKVTLPESLVNKLLLRKGETVCLIQEDGIKDKCFKVTAENEKELFDEDFYCIPKRYLICVIWIMKVFRSSLNRDKWSLPIHSMC